MDKELFVKNINTIKALWDKIDELNSVTDGAIALFEINEIFDVTDGLINLLRLQMCDGDGDIVYFMCELNFGKDYTDGCMVDVDGNNIDISTVEKLYDYLMNKQIMIAFEQDEEIRSTPVN